MPFTSKPINSYQLVYRSLYDAQAHVSCYSGTGEHVGSLLFYDDTRPVPVRNSFIGTSTIPGMVFKSSQFLHILTLLREEKPLFFNFTTESMTGYLSSTNEPVGEDEGP
jgi:hypothetical protein